MNFVMWKRALLERRRWMLGWSIGSAAFIIINLAFYPSFKGQANGLNEAMKSLPASVKGLVGLGGDLDPLSSLGYLSSKVFSLTLPLLLLIAAIGFGASFAHDEQFGLLEVPLTTPISRRRILLGRFAALCSALGMISLVATVTTLIAARPAQIDVGAGGIISAGVAVLVLAITGGTISLAVAAATGRRALALGVSSTLVVSSYVIDSLAGANITFFTSIRPYSMFAMYDAVGTLRRGAPSLSVLWLAAITAGLVTAAIVGFDHRDIRA